MFPGWRALCDMLTIATLSCGTLGEITAERFTPHFWDYPALGSALKHADEGLPKDNFWKGTTANTVNSLPPGFLLDRQSSSNFNERIPPASRWL